MIKNIFKHQKTDRRGSGFYSSLIIHHSSFRRSGFTLIELILVMGILAIVGILSALVIPNAIDIANTRQTEATMNLIYIACEAYKSDMGNYPRVASTGIEAILTLTTGGWSRASLNTWFEGRHAVVDAWDQPFYYCQYLDYDVAPGRGVERTPGKKDFYNSMTYQLYSTGPNLKTWSQASPDGHPRLQGTEPDDIRNWKQETFYDTKPAGY